MFGDEQFAPKQGGALGAMNQSAATTQPVDFTMVLNNAGDATNMSSAMANLMNSNTMGFNDTTQNTKILTHPYPNKPQASTLRQGKGPRSEVVSQLTLSAPQNTIITSNVHDTFSKPAG